MRKISDGRIFEGFFKSPLAIAAPGLLPEEAETARYVINSNVYLLHNFFVAPRFELILPKEAPSQNTPVYIQLAGTGDHVSEV